MAPIVPARRGRDLSLLIFLSFILGCALFIYTRAYSSNGASRLAAVESLVQRGRWIIDEATGDKIKVGEHFYSDKPPILSLGGADVCAALHNAFGLTLQLWGCTPNTGLVLALGFGTAIFLYSMVFTNHVGVVGLQP